MPEINQYTFDHTELTELLIKKMDLHEGLWQISIEFTFFATNMPMPPDGKTIMPAGVSIIKKIGLHRADAVSTLTVDAAKVNPSVPTLISKKR